MALDLRVIPWPSVAAAIAESTADPLAPSTRCREYCTASHTRTEILAAVPEAPLFAHATPPWPPYGYLLWRPLLARSQALAPTASFTASIPSFLWTDIRACHFDWYTRGAIRPDLLAATLELWAATRQGKELARTLDGTRDWFVRLDHMSMKDSPLGGDRACRTMEDVLRVVASSMRAYGCLVWEAGEAEREGREMRIGVVGNAWDAGMDVEREFRVFVPPPGARVGAGADGGKEVQGRVGVQGFRISAISQYAWCRKFAMVEVDGEDGGALRDFAMRVHDEAQKLLGEIVRFVEIDVDEGTRDLLVQYGFTFDVVVKEGWVVQIVEVNPFGAMSACGACLFHWVRDGRALYGLNGDEVQFAVTM